MDTGSAQQCVGVSTLIGQDHGNDVAGVSGPRGAPRTMEVGLVLGGRIDVDHQLDIVDVHAARRDVGCHQHPGLAGGECSKIAIACGLRKVAVQVN